MSKIKTIANSGSIDILVCPECDLVHLVIFDEAGNAQFSAPLSDHEWDIIFIEVTSLRAKRNNANRLKKND